MEDGISKIPWRSKRSPGDIDRLNDKGRETQSDEGLSRVGEVKEEEPLPEDPNDRATVMLDFIRNLPEVQNAVSNLQLPPSTVAWRDINLLGLKTELMLSDRGRWRAKPFYYLDLGIEWKRKKEALDVRLQQDEAEKQKSKDEFEQRFGGWRWLWPRDKE